MVTLEHTEFRYPHPWTIINKTNIPHHQRYHHKRSHLKNRKAFKVFLTTVEALHCPKYSYTTVFLVHDTKTCFICDKTRDVMHGLNHHKGSQQYFMFGTGPPEDIPNKFAPYGLYLEVVTGSEYNEAMPICSDCKATRKKKQILFLPGKQNGRLPNCMEHNVSPLEKSHVLTLLQLCILGRRYQTGYAFGHVNLPKSAHVLLEMAWKNVHACCALVERFGPSFSVLLDIIAEEEQCILAPNKLWQKKTNYAIRQITVYMLISLVDL